MCFYTSYLAETHFSGLGTLFCSCIFTVDQSLSSITRRIVAIQTQPITGYMCWFFFKHKNMMTELKQIN